MIWPQIVKPNVEEHERLKSFQHKFKWLMKIDGLSWREVKKRWNDDQFCRWCRMIRWTGERCRGSWSWRWSANWCLPELSKWWSSSTGATSKPSELKKRPSWNLWWYQSDCRPTAQPWLIAPSEWRWSCNFEWDRRVALRWATSGRWEVSRVRTASTKRCRLCCRSWPSRRRRGADSGISMSLATCTDAVTRRWRPARWPPPPLGRGSAAGSIPQPPGTRSSVHHPCPKQISN